MNQDTLRAFRANSRTMVQELGFMQEAWAPAGLSHAQVHILLELADAGMLRPSHLAERLRSDPAVVSRATRDLADKSLIRTAPDPGDRRQRLHSLTEAGTVVVRGIHQDADSHVVHAFDVLDPSTRDIVIQGMAAYAKALRRTRLQQGVRIREIRSGDDPAVTALIRTVMPEFGASGPGYAIVDPEVDAMSVAYGAPRSAYFVIERDGQVLGGAGFAPLAGGDKAVCELRKMYFHPELRGMGMGARLLGHILEAATVEGYTHCYLETLTHMQQARRLYEAFGFEALEASMGQTGHHKCDAWYLRRLR